MVYECPLRQIGAEIHTGKLEAGFRNTLTRLLRSFQALKKDFGFDLVSYNPNGCFHKIHDYPGTNFYSYFDILFVNKNSQSPPSK